MQHCCTLDWALSPKCSPLDWIRSSFPSRLLLRSWLHFAFPIFYSICPLCGKKKYILDDEGGPLEGVAQVKEWRFAPSGGNDHETGLCYCMNITLVSSDLIKASWMMIYGWILKGHVSQTLFTYYSHFIITTWLEKVWKPRLSILFTTCH